MNFKAQEINSKDWVYGFYLETGSHSSGLNGYGWIVVPDHEEHSELSGNPIEDLTNTYAVDMDTVCVGSLERDSEGKHIFSGDVIDENFLVTVVFKDGCFMVKGEGIHQTLKSWLNLRIKAKCPSKIIGNIHDN